MMDDGLFMSELNRVTNWVSERVQSEKGQSNDRWIEGVLCLSALGHTGKQSALERQDVFAALAREAARERTFRDAAEKLETGQIEGQATSYCRTKIDHQCRLPVVSDELDAFLISSGNWDPIFHHLADA